LNLRKDIISRLPYDQPFLFVDEISEVRDGFIKGSYTFPKDAEFYKGHFKGKPVTPGVLLTECAAQIGLVCYAIFKLKVEKNSIGFGMTSAEMEFLKPHFPGERITVEAEEIYHRFGKLKMKVKLFDDDNNILAIGKIAGMPINYNIEK
jgi:3-hydroxyacyl-[acyl-carrier-protein] dehydratase